MTPGEIYFIVLQEALTRLYRVRHVTIASKRAGEAQRKRRSLELRWAPLGPNGAQRFRF